MSLLDVREGEGRAVATTLLLSFLIGIPRAFTFTVANTLFVEYLGPDALPWAYALGAPVVALAGLLYVGFERRRGLIAVGILGSFLFAAILFSAHRALTAGLGVTSIAFSLVVLAEAEFTFTNITFWNVANRLFTVRQAARLFGLISAGQGLPAIAGGLAIPSLLAHLPVSALLVVSAIGHLGAAALIGFGLRRLPTWRQVSPEPLGDTRSATARTRALLADPYLRGVALLIGLQVFVFYAVDNAFYFAAEAQLGRGEAMAAFLGRFLIALGVAGIAFQVALSGSWRRWLGLRSALISTPMTLLVLGALGLAASQLEVSPWAVFGLVVVLKLWERVAVSAIHSPSYYSLFLPLPADTRAEAQSTLESVVAQAAAVLGGACLITVNQAFDLGLVGLLGAIVLFASGWVVTSASLSKRYREQLRSALARRRIEPGALPIADATTIDLLEEGARSEDPARVIRSFEILEELEVKDLHRIASELLSHRHDRVVEAAARLLEKHPNRADIPSLEARLARGGQPGTLARIARALAACAGPEAVPALTPHLDARSPRLRAGVATALLRYCGGAGAGPGRRAVEALLADPSPALRARGARTIGSARRGDLAPLLRPLLDDLDADVARTAVWAAGRLGAWTGLLPVVIQALGRPGLAGEASRALTRFGPVAFEAIAERLHHSHADSAAERLVRQRLLRVVNHLPGPAPRALLESSLHSIQTRHEALLGLERSSDELTPSERTALARLLDEELEIGRLLLRARRDELGSRHPLLDRALRDDASTHSDRLLLLLGCLFDKEAIREARRHRAPGNPDTEALALELVEAALPEEVAARVLPAIEVGPAAPRPERMGEARGALSTNQILAELAHGGRASPSLAAIAAAAISTQGDDDTDASLARLGALADVELFELLELEHLALVAQRAERLTFQPGDRLLRLSDPNDRVVVLVTGRARWAGAGAPPSKRVAPSDLALIRPIPRGRELVAQTEGSLLRLSGELLNDLFDDAPDAAWRVLEHLCRRARGSVQGHATPAEPQLGTAKVPYSELLRLMRELEVLPALAKVSTATLASVARSAQEVELAAGQIVIEEGAVDSTLYILLSGSTRVRKGREEIARLDAPAIFGELAAILPAPRTATIVAEIPSRALALPREALYALMYEERGILSLILELVVARLAGGAADAGPPPRLRIPVQDTTV